MKPTPLTPSADGMVRIGARVRAAREARGLTLEQLAHVTGLNKGSISRIENDSISPTAHTLWILCGVLDITVGSLFEHPDATHIKRGDQPIATIVGELVFEHLVTPRRQRRLQLTHATISPGGNSGERLFTINCQVEVAYVLSGTLDIVFASQTTRVAAGEALTFSGHEPHNWVNPSDREDTEVIWVMVPAPWSAADDTEGG